MGGVYIGGTGDDSLRGTKDSDHFDISQGGHDTIDAKQGADTILAGAALDALDHIDGGDGGDYLVLNGDYSGGLVFTDTTVVNVELFVLGGGFDYDLTFAQGCIVTRRFMLEATESQDHDHLRLDLSAFIAGQSSSLQLGGGIITVVGGDANDFVHITGAGRAWIEAGAGEDQIELLREIGARDHFDGGDSEDFLRFQLGADTVLRGSNLRNIENLDVSGNGVSLTMADGNLSGRETMNIHLSGGGQLRFDGSAERSGAFHVMGTVGDDAYFGGGGDDTLLGAEGNDTLVGGAGADLLGGGDGSNTFIYRQASDSDRHHGTDLVAGLNTGDIIDLSQIDARQDKAGDQAFHLVDVFTHHSGELAFSYDASADQTTLAGDVDGDGRADLVIQLSGDQTGFGGLVL